MRKIYLAVSLLFISVGLFAQNLEILDMDRVNYTGDTLEREATSSDSLEIHLMVANTNTKDISVLVKKYEIMVQEGTENLFCWKSCYPPNVYEATTPVTIAAEDTNKTDFYLDFYPKGVTGENKIGITFFNEANPDDSANVVVSLSIGQGDSTSTGIGIRNDIMLSSVEVYPSIVYNRLHIVSEVINMKGTQIEIFDISGKKLFHEVVSESTYRRNISVARLERGIYIVRMIKGDLRTQRRFIKR
jgi:hypothetical protein